MILILDHVLSLEDCQRLVDFHNDSPRHSYGDTIVCPSNRSDLIWGAANRIERLAQQYFGKHEIDWAEVVCWPENSRQEFHVDAAKETTTIASITYLSASFRGGETRFIDGTTVAPKVGRTLFFFGREIEHGVAPIIGGNRFTLPIWYKQKD